MNSMASNSTGKALRKAKTDIPCLPMTMNPEQLYAVASKSCWNTTEKSPLVSFGFVAAPDLERDIKGKKLDPAAGSRRFRFYQRMMINLFGPKTFYQASDTTNTIYLMINMEQLESGAVTFKDIENRLNQTYEGTYVVDDPPG